MTDTPPDDLSRADRRPADAKPTLKALLDCAAWLSTCLALGWRRADLDALEALWWQYHDHRGSQKPSESSLGAANTDDRRDVLKGSRR